jgi:hypothetical protein
VSAVNEPHNIDFTIEKDNRKPKSGRRESTVPSEWKRRKTKLLRNTGHKYRTFKRSTDILEQKIDPLWGHRYTGMFFFRVIRSGNT